MTDTESHQLSEGSDGEQLGASLHRKMGRSASQLFVRLLVVQLLSAGSTAILARKLTVSGFGAYSAGLAMFFVALSICDFGFGSQLARELGAGRADDGSLVRSMLRVQTAWSATVGLCVVGFALAIGFRELRIQVLLVLVPAVAMFGLTGARQVFYASYRTARLGAIDVATNVVQVIVISLVALSGGGPVAVAATYCVMLVINTLIVVIVGLRLVDDSPSSRLVQRRMFLHSLPLGVSSLLASAYFTIDLIIVSFLVPSQEVGYYAAATKALGVLVMIPALVVSTATAGLSSQATNRADLGRLSAKTWQWLTATAVPICMAMILFAPEFVRIFYGRLYQPAIPLVRILAISGVVVAMSNVLGAAMVVTKRNRWLVIQGSFLLAFNVSSNFALVPRFGVTASAWLTVLTELLVCVGAIWSLHGRIDLGPIAKSTLAPAIAVAMTVSVWWATAHWEVASMILCGSTFALVLWILGGWPEDLPAPLPRKLVLWRQP